MLQAQRQLLLPPLDCFRLNNFCCHRWTACAFDGIHTISARRRCAYVKTNVPKVGLLFLVKNNNRILLTKACSTKMSRSAIWPALFKELSQFITQSTIGVLRIFVLAGGGRAVMHEGLLGFFFLSLFLYLPSSKGRSIATSCVR